MREYVKFGKKVKFITGDTDETIGENNKYDDKDKYLKFNGSRSEE